MRINPAAISQLRGALPDAGQHQPALTPGQRLIVTVLANDGGLLELLAADETGTTAGESRAMAARTTLPLVPGQRFPVIVSGRDGAQVILRLADGQGELTPLTPETLAATLGLPGERAWQAVVQSLIRDSLPLTRDLAEQVMTLWRRSRLPAPEAASLLWLSRHGIAPTPERVALVRAFRNAHQGRGEPPDEAVMASVSVPGDGESLEFSIFMAGIDAPVVQPDGYGQRRPGAGDADAAPTDDSAVAAAAGRPAVVLLSVPTQHLGRVEALVELTGETVAVTCFTDDAAAVQALAADIDRLRTALVAGGLAPGLLTARRPVAARRTEPGITRLDVRL